MKNAVAAASILVASVAGTAACIAFVALTPHERIPVGLRVQDVSRFLAMQVSLTVVGALIVWRRPHNRVGWFLSAAAVLSAAQLFAAGYAVHGVFGDTPLPRPEIAAWIFVWLDGAVALGLGLTALTFPDGRFHSGRARFGAALGLVGTVLGAGFLALRPGPLFNITFVDNPFGVAILAQWQVPLLALIVLVLVGANALIVSSLWERLRRSTGEEREQLKWVFAAVGVTAASLVFGFPFVFIDWEATKSAWAVALCLIPLSIGVAILRHRLYDIDVLINRTVVYGATTATLVATYALTVLVAQTLLRPVTQGSEIAVAASTLVVASLVQPVRRRMQTAVDRRFYRSHYDAVRTLDAFGNRLRDEVDLNALRRELLGVVRDTMQPAHASVWLRDTR